jgi:hypothetical protein
VATRATVGRPVRRVVPRRVASTLLRPALRKTTAWLRARSRRRPRRRASMAIAVRRKSVASTTARRGSSTTVARARRLRTPLRVSRSESARKLRATTAALRRHAARKARRKCSSVVLADLAAAGLMVTRGGGGASIRLAKFPEPSRARLDSGEHPAIGFRKQAKYGRKIGYHERVNAGDSPALGLRKGVARPAEGRRSTCGSGVLRRVSRA